jgi:hypothetical protein
MMMTSAGLTRLCIQLFALYRGWFGNNIDLETSYHQGRHILLSGMYPVSNILLMFFWTDGDLQAETAISRFQAMCAA